jgi:hypothetical protein
MAYGFAAVPSSFSYRDVREQSRRPGPIVEADAERNLDAFVPFVPPPLNPKLTLHHAAAPTRIRAVCLRETHIVSAVTQQSKRLVK